MKKPDTTLTARPVSAGEKAEGDDGGRVPVLVLAGAAILAAGGVGAYAAKRRL